MQRTIASHVISWPMLALVAALAGAGCSDTPTDDDVTQGETPPVETETPSASGTPSATDTPTDTDTPGGSTDTPGGSTDTPGGGTSTPGGDTPGGTDQPGTDQPGTSTPGGGTPGGTDQPGTDQPGTDQPGTDQPGTDQPGTDTPPVLVPDVAVSSSSIDFDTVFLGESGSALLTVSNEGDATLNLSIDVANTSGGDFSLDPFSPSPSTLAAGDDVQLELVFSPAGTGHATGTLTITSDDPDESTVVVQLQGDGEEPPPTDADHDGYTPEDGDCDDGDGTVYPGADETCDGKDNDCDAQTDEDGDSTFYADDDSDGHGDAADTVVGCDAPGGYVASSDDCDDTDPTVYTGAAEQCDGQDNDCDDQIDEGVQSTFYADDDGDGHGDAGSPVQACAATDGTVTSSDDCNDHAASIYPGATEACNGVDDDCDSQVDEGALLTFYPDADGDGFGNAAGTTQTGCTPNAGYTTDATDCNDSNDTVYPGADETCNGVDDDCDGAIDDNTQKTYYRDADGDGFGTSSDTKTDCAPPSGYVPRGGDCDDANASTYPGAAEKCDGVDNNCDGNIDEASSSAPLWYLDQDGDGYGGNTTQRTCTKPTGYVSVGGDCDDLNAAIHPGADEIAANGIDEDCNGSDLTFVDLDQDGFGDIVVANRQSSSSVFKINSTVYWGSEKGIDPTVKSDLPTQGASAVCIADFDDDGWQDLLFANYASASSTFAVDSYLYFGSPAGFSTGDRVDLPTLGATDCHVDDLDGDGDTDIVFANQYDGSKYSISSYIYWNDNGLFTRANRTDLPTIGAYSVTTSDLNQDGRRDLIFSNFRDGSNYKQNSYVYMNTASGFGTGSRLNLPSVGPWRKATVADMNLDGSLDILVNNWYDGSSYNVSSYVYWGPNYTSKTDVASNGNSGSIVKDFDEDGFPDIAIGSYYDGDNSTSSWVYYGSSKGFETTNRVALATNRVYDIASSDLDGNGYDDLVMAMYYDGDYNANSVIFWGSEKRFATSSRLDLPATGASAVSIGDVDADGYNDVAFGSLSDGDNTSTGYIYWNSPRGIGQSHRTDLPGYGATHASIEDLDKDGNMDVVIANQQSTTSAFAENSLIYWGNETGVSTTDPTALPSLGASWTCVEDFDKDGYADIVIANYRDSATRKVDSYVYWGSSAGYSTSDRSSLPTLGAQHCLAADLDKDGDLDLVFSNYYNDSSYAIDSYIYLNVGGNFSTANRISVPTSGAYASVAADLDGNGYLDILFSNYYNGSSYNVGSYLYWGDSSGYSTTRRQLFASHGPLRPAVMEDLNKDGYIDIVIAGYYDGDNSVNTYVYYGSATGYTDTNRLTIAVNRVIDAKASDLDGDGWKDLVLPTYYDGDETNNSYVYWGGSSGYSNSNRVSLAGNRSYGVLISDLDADGYSDLVFPTWYDGNYAVDSPVYYGSATGYSAARLTKLASIASYFAFSADFDHDGLGDVLFVNNRSGDSSSYSFNVSSYIYWSSERGLNSSNRTAFPTIGAYDLKIVGAQ